MTGHPTSRRRLATSYDDADSSPGLLLWQVTNRWQAAIRAALKQHGLTHVQFVLLASLTWLDVDDELVTQRRLADHAATDPMMTSQVVRVLARRGLVERREHPEDARAKWLVVTPEGAALANRTVGVVEAVDREFFGRLGTTEAAFARALGLLAAT
ncbi:MAG: MarR family winged helix-turn-helix transcriptional regulator [Nocardioides sp.]